MAGAKVINLQQEEGSPIKPGDGVSQLVSRDSQSQGVYSALFQNQLRNAILPGLYETLREAIPLLDLIIVRLISLDGVPVIVGDNTRAVEELHNFFRTVQVGDNQAGIPSYIHAKRDEVHEQGFGISQHMLGVDGIFRLDVADSKAIHFARKNDGSLGWYFDPFQKSRMVFNPSATEKVAQILQHRTPINIAAAYYEDKGFVELDRRRTHYLAYRTENSDDYGVSLLRSLPFFAELMLTISTALANTWQRFGDPSYHLEYKAGGRLGDAKDANGDPPLEQRRKKLATDLAAAVSVKRQGKSADLVTAVDKDSEIKVSIIGAEGTVLDATVPLKVVTEQLSGRLPAWMLGIDAGSVQGQAKFQSEVVQQESATRTDIESIHLEHLCAVHLRARGITWSDQLVRVDDPYSPGGYRMVRRDWRVEYRKPNLSDVVARSQANFMDTQSRVLSERSGLSDDDTSSPVSVTTEDIDGNKTTTTHNILGAQLPPANTRPSTQHICDGHMVNEIRPIENPALDKIESDALSAISDEWNETTLYLVRALGLESTDQQNSTTPDGYEFTEDDKQLIAAELAAFAAAMVSMEGLNRGPISDALLRSWAQGVIDAYNRSGLDNAVGELNNDAAIAKLLETSKAEFTTFIDNKLTGRIHRILEAGAAAGENPINIAANLKREMGGASWKWEQIARSEIAIASDEGKRDEWRAEVDSDLITDKFDWIPAPDACPVCMALTSGNPYTLSTLPRVVVDTHPSDRCDTAPAVTE